MLYGITHDPETSAAIVRVPRIYKVGIGVPAKGPDIRVFINQADKRWTIQHKPNGSSDYKFDYLGVATGTEEERTKARSQAQARFKELYGKCAARRFPEKLPYFTFSRLGPDGNYYPAWEVIEAHGACPTEIDIVFNENTPFATAYQLWGANKLKCSGDGVDARRSADFPFSQAEQKIAAEAKTRGLRTFPVKGCCYVSGCPMARSQGKDSKGEDKRPECVPHGTLQFHLVRAPRLGAVSQFDTTSIRSIQNLFACINAILGFTGGSDVNRGFVAGIPLKLLLRPFHVVVKGKASKAYAVQLEFRAETIRALRADLDRFAAQWRGQLAGTTTEAAQAQLKPTFDVPLLEAAEETEGMQAAMMSAEFSDGEGDSTSDAVGEKANGRIEQLSQQINQAISGTSAGAPQPAAEIIDAEVEDVVEADESDFGLFEDGAMEAGGNPGDKPKQRGRKKAE